MIPLKKDALYLLDGGVSTELERMGYSLQHRLWSARLLSEAPDAIREVHRRFSEAGADFATTTTYQATPQGLMNEGFSSREAEKLIRRSVSLAREAHDGWIALSIGSYGAYLADGSEYRGDFDLSVNELVDFHRPRFEILLDELRPDSEVFAFETIPSWTEVEAICRLLEEVPSEVGGWLSLSLRSSKLISSGESLADVVRNLENVPTLFAVGVNCLPPEWVSAAIQEIKEHTPKRIIVYPNSGESYDASKKVWKTSEREQEDDFSVKEWIRLGASLLGGCCRTTPAEIQKIKREL